MDQNDDRFSSRSEYFEALEDHPINPSSEPTLGDVINRRFNRRELLKGALGVAAIGVLARVPILGDAEAAEKDSHAMGLLEYPHYTRPAEYRGWHVPEVLLSGNHANVDIWRRQEALKRTFFRRPDSRVSGGRV